MPRSCNDVLLRVNKCAIYALAGESLWSPDLETRPGVASKWRSTTWQTRFALGLRGQSSPLPWCWLVALDARRRARPVRGRLERLTRPFVFLEKEAFALSGRYRWARCPPPSSWTSIRSFYPMTFRIGGGTTETDRAVQLRAAVKSKVGDAEKTLDRHVPCWRQRLPATWCSSVVTNVILCTWG